MFSNHGVDKLEKLTSVATSHHTLFNTLKNVVTMQISLPEIICFGTFCFILIIFIISSLKKGLSKDGSLLAYQEAEVPDYFEALREQELEEMVDEEKMFLQELGSQNMSEKNLKIASNVLNDKFRMSTQDKNPSYLHGEPYY